MRQSGFVAEEVKSAYYVNDKLMLTQNGISNPGYYTFNLDKFIPFSAETGEGRDEIISIFEQFSK